MPNDHPSDRPPDPPVTVRPATRADLDPLARLAAEPFRRRGIALELFAALVRAARTAGVTRVRWTNPASGPGARGFADTARYPRFRVTDKIDCTLPVAV